MGLLLDACKPAFKSCSFGKLQTDTVAYFYKMRDVNRCNIYGFKNSTASDASILYSYNYSDKPDEKICGLDKCDMTGTLFVTNQASDGDFASVTTQIQANGEDFQYGYLRVFIYGNAGDKFTLIVKNADGTAANSFDITLANDGWNPEVIELFNPTLTVGNGWVGENDSFNLIVEAKQADDFRLSTAELFEEIYDMVRDQTIGFTCISDFSGDPALTLTEDLCSTDEYDDTATKIERTITASNIIGELADFANITRRQKASEHLAQTRDEFTATAETLNGVDYAVFTMPEMADITCPRLLVQPQDCRFDTLYHSDVDNDSSTIDLPEDYYFRKGNKVYMHKSYVGATIVVAYPIWIEGTAWDITSDDLNKQHYQMEMVTPICGDEYLIKADNVFLTAIPLSWTDKAGTFTVPFTMSKDNFGKYGTIVKIDGRK